MEDDGIVVGVSIEGSEEYPNLLRATLTDLGTGCRITIEIVDILDNEAWRLVWTALTPQAIKHILDCVEVEPHGTV